MFKGPGADDTVGCLMGETSVTSSRTSFKDLGRGLVLQCLMGHIKGGSLGPRLLLRLAIN